MLRELYAEKADEVAYRLYNKPYWELSMKLKDEVYEQAMEEVNDWMIDEAEVLGEGER